jgi:DNA ligase-1
MTLARDWDFRDCTGYFWSEKFDGCRAFWDGYNIWTRDGNIVKAPTGFTSRLPCGVALDGEIWCGRAGYIEAMKAVRHGIFTDACRFVAFDFPDASGTWLERMNLADLHRNEIVMTPERGVIGFREEPSELADTIIKAGGEGLMLRHPKILRYETKRTNHLMRVKAKNLFAPWHGMSDNRTGNTFLLKLAFDPEIAWRVDAAL